MRSTNIAVVSAAAVGRANGASYERVAAVNSGTRNGAVREFEKHRAAQADEVFGRHPDLVYDHRCHYPWLTGALGDPFCDVWFVAENPSLTQVERVQAPSPEAQWRQSRADQLFRRMLVEHGFKDGPADAPGGWRCYITDVTKSADRAGVWSQAGSDAQQRTIEAWAPVLRWELETAQPKLLVSVGKKADRFLTRLLNDGLLGRLPPRMQVAHYTYVASRPHGKLGPMHPERVNAYSEEFAQVAQRAAELRSVR